MPSGDDDALLSVLVIRGFSPAGAMQLVTGQALAGPKDRLTLSTGWGARCRTRVTASNVSGPGQSAPAASFSHHTVAFLPHSTDNQPVVAHWRGPPPMPDDTPAFLALLTEALELSAMQLDEHAAGMAGGDSDPYTRGVRDGIRSAASMLRKSADVVSRRKPPAGE